MAGLSPDSVMNGFLAVVHVLLEWLFRRINLFMSNLRC